MYTSDFIIYIHVDRRIWWLASANTYNAVVITCGIIWFSHCQNCPILAEYSCACIRD